jgi:cytochrome P450
MTLFPEAQRKTQEEIDQVLGDQLPTVADRGNLPYMDAISKEVLRWHPVAPVAIPHMSVEDGTWEDFYIPKGSLMLPNIWAFRHDPEVYHDIQAGAVPEGRRTRARDGSTHDRFWVWASSVPRSIPR